MSRVVIAAFRPKPGMSEELLRLVQRHWGVLDEQGLVTPRARFVMQAKDGTVVEVFEWKSPEAVERAHGNPVVLRLWSEFEAACDYVPIGALEEAGHLFSEFDAIATFP